MRGIAERDRRGQERDVALAWWIERLAREKMLKGSPKHYLDKLRPRKPQSGADVLAVFREYQARGAPISIKQFGPDGKELN